ncbi:hypothetical protein [Pseudomonas sp. KCJK9016]|uniref:hypothetical protein n=1 Tax=Pseudomonas sp. KCJK9016 TaxID=3344556 RepID=UPI003905D15B
MRKFFDELMESVKQADEFFAASTEPTANRVSMDFPKNPINPMIGNTYVSIENPDRSGNTIALHWNPAQRGI